MLWGGLTFEVDLKGTMGVHQEKKGKGRESQAGARLSKSHRVRGSGDEGEGKKEGLCGSWTEPTEMPRKEAWVVHRGP